MSLEGSRRELRDAHAQVAEYKAQLEASEKSASDIRRRVTPHDLFLFSSSTNLLLRSLMI